MLAGLGTVAVEIVRQLPELDAIVVPACTGALVAAVLVACKTLKNSCLVYVNTFLYNIFINYFYR